MLLSSTVKTLRSATSVRAHDLFVGSNKYILAKVYLSVFPSEKAETLVDEIKQLGPKIKHEIAQKVKHQLRKMPELIFYNDDSLEYIENIEKAVKGEENPLENPDLLDRRKKK